MCAVNRLAARAARGAALRSYPPGAMPSLCIMSAPKPATRADGSRRAYTTMTTHDDTTVSHCQTLRRRALRRRALHHATSHRVTQRGARARPAESGVYPIPTEDSTPCYALKRYQDTPTGPQSTKRQTCRKEGKRHARPSAAGGKGAAGAQDLAVAPEEDRGGDANGEGEEAEERVAPAVAERGCAVGVSVRVRKIAGADQDSPYM